VFGVQQNYTTKAPMKRLAWYMLYSL